MENMGIWNRNRKIDSKYTKKANVGGQAITSFSLQSVVQMATQEFGPFGKGWGYEIEMERFDEGAIIQEQVTHENGDIQPQIKEITHTLLIRFWYIMDNEKIICPIQAGHTPYLRRTKYGPNHDDEYYKKTLADAIKKSLSMLGFAADIFLGMMDDPEYEKLQESERNLQREAELPQKIEDFGREVKALCRLYEKTSMTHSLRALMKSNAQKINVSCSRLGIDPIPYLSKSEEAYKSRVEQLKQEAESNESN